MDTSEEISLNSKLETDIFNLGLNKENQNYKLVVQWDMENTSQNLDEILNVEILVKGVQKL